MVNPDDTSRYPVGPECRWRQTSIRQHQQWPACVLLLGWRLMNFAATVRKSPTT
jgi:hypothetical protein